MSASSATSRSARTCRSPSCSASTTRSSSPPARRTTGRSASRATTCPAWSDRRRSSAGITAIPISPISHPPLDGPGAVVIGNGNVALDVARILAKTGDEFAGSDIVGHALDRARRPRDHETITILGRRGPHQIAMTPKELGELGHLDARGAARRSRRPAARGATTPRSIPGLRKSVTHLRDFATVDRRQADHDRLRFLRHAGRDRRRRQGRARDRRAHRDSTPTAARDGTGETYADPRRRWSSAASAIAPRRSRACPMTPSSAASPMTRGGSAPASTRSAGRGAGRPARSAPTAPTAS